MADEIARLPLSEINVDYLTIVLDHSEGGFFDPTDGQSCPCIEGEAIDSDGDSVDADELGWLGVQPLQSQDAYRDMRLFADAVTDERMSGRFLIALDGAGALHRFRSVMYDAPEDLRRLWNRFQEIRLRQLTLEWLLNEDVVIEEQEQEAAAAEEAIGADLLELVSSWKPSGA